MPRRFRIKPGIHEVYLKGAGRVTRQTLLEGDDYAQYCPQYLVEILDSTPVAAPPPVLVEPKLESSVKAEDSASAGPRVLTEKVEKPKVKPPPFPPISPKKETASPKRAVVSRPSFDELKSERQSEKKERKRREKIEKLTEEVSGTRSKNVDSEI